MFQIIPEMEKRWKENKFPDRDEWLSREVAKRQFEIVKNWWPKDRKPDVLDLGCGAGQYSRLPHEFYLGIDLDISAAEQKYPLESFEQGRFDNHLKQSIYDRLYDIVLCLNVLRHYEDPLALFESILWDYSARCYIFTFLTADTWWRGQLSKAFPEEKLYKLADNYAHKFDKLIGHHEEPEGVKWWLAKIS